jgi:hypothetical protein
VVLPDSRRPHHAERDPTIGAAEASPASATLYLTPAIVSECHAPATPVFTYLRPAMLRAFHRFVLPSLIWLP